MDLARCYLHLLPGAQFGTTNNDHALTEWLDPRPMPTLEEVEVAWVAVQAEAEREQWNRPILERLAANDAALGIRAISEALAGDSTRLDAFRADQAALRAQLR